jgi:hypothetical protein
MRNSSKDIWDYTQANTAICIPVNLMVKKNGKAVMGAGLALAATKRVPGIAKAWGEIIYSQHNVLVAPIGRWHDATVLSFPTKLDWKDPSDLALIALSAAQLSRYADRFDSIVLPKVGAGLGKLDFETQVRPILNVAFGTCSKYSIL